MIMLDEQRRIVAYLDSVQARLASLRELQSATGEELDALLPSHGDASQSVLRPHEVPVAQRVGGRRLR